jgi:hypothetical protein
VFCVLLLCLFNSFGLPVAAQETIRVVESSATTDFPATITFALSAESSGAEIVAVDLLYGATRSEVLTVVELAVTPATQVRVEHVLDTQVNYLPPGTDITYRWLIRDAAGAEFSSPPQSLFYHDQRFNWSERSERNVTVYWYEGGERFGDELMQTSLRTLDVLRGEIGAELAQPVRIYIYANNSDMRSALQSNEVEWVGGQAWTGLGIILGAIEAGDSAEVQRIVPHELSHQVLHQATDNPYGGLPVWFDEGLAVYNQETRDAGFDGLVETAAEEGTLIPLESLSSSFPADPDQAYLSYAQSRDVVEFIIASYGEAKVQELVVQFRAATPVEEALQQVLGVSVDELDTQWRATLPVAAAIPTPAPGPQNAPPDRFDNAPGGIALPDPSTSFDDIFTGLPSWGFLAIAVTCMVVLFAVGGGLLLVVLRVIGVDKRA